MDWLFYYTQELSLSFLVMFKEIAQPNPTKIQHSPIMSTARTVLLVDNCMAALASRRS
jgi:hypothetical protein